MDNQGEMVRMRSREERQGEIGRMDSLGERIMGSMKMDSLRLGAWIIGGIPGLEGLARWMRS